GTASWSCASRPAPPPTRRASGCGSPPAWPRPWAAAWPPGRTACGPGWGARRPGGHPGSVGSVRTDSCQRRSQTAGWASDVEGGTELDIVRLALVDDGGPFGRDVEALIESASAGAVTVVGRTADHKAAVELVRRRR